MATIEKYQTGSGATHYRVRYRTPDKRSTDKSGFRTKRDAQYFANDVEVKKLTGDFIAPKLGKVTVDELSAAWLTLQKASHCRKLLPHTGNLLPCACQAALGIGGRRRC